MDSNVFLAPCDPANFERTVLTEVDLGDYPDHPSALSGMETVRFWGVREGSRNETYFEKMESGDIVLFYQDGDYVGTGRVGTTFEDEAGWASTTFWNDAPSWLVYTIEKFEQISVPKSVVNGVLGYQEDYNPQGLIRVAEHRLDKRPASYELALKKYTERNR